MAKTLLLHGRQWVFLTLSSLMALGLISCDSEQSSAPELSTTQRIANPDNDPQNWLSHGRDYGEQRFSPLTNINKGNVQELGLAWEFDMQSMRGLEATPLVVDGVMYVTSTWSRVFALNAKTGEELWRFDPKVPRAWARKLCCDIVNRGVALAEEKILFGTLDGRLLALDQTSGKLLWEVDTLVNRDQWYSITGAPRVVKDKVIIGNGGAEFGVRGYISAYYVDSGKLAWRFFTVPGSPDQPYENEALKQAAKTWHGVTDWSGLGGTAWDSMAFDPELNLLYVGTGNGSPWPRFARSPGGGDNLFLASILALDPDSGELQWFYQTTPGDNWDFTATQNMILADLSIRGQSRKVLMQAPKNGFFYVLDRTNGELISAEPFVFVNWASHVDLDTGRPMETKRGDYGPGETAYVFPSPAGGHNWQPMSFSPDTGLVYIPTRDVGWVFTEKEDKWFTYGVDDLTPLIDDQPLPDTKGHLKAWDPVKQEVVWQVESELVWNGGTLATAGGLVFYGTAAGEFLALNASTGTVLKKIETGTGIIAPPISFAVEDEQYVAVLAGWGGPAFNTMQGTEAAMQYSNRGRLLVFALGGDEVPLPETRAPLASFSEPPGSTASAEVLETGRLHYVYQCGSCHGLYGSTPLLPDLRRLTPEKHAIFADIVIGGLLEELGMPDFSDTLDPKDVEAIQAYVYQLTREAIAREQQNQVN